MQPPPPTDSRSSTGSCDRWHDLSSAEELARVIGDTNVEERKQLDELARVVRVEGKFWTEQRRLAAKGMLGKAWSSWLLDNGADPTEIRDLIKGAFNRATKYGVAITELFHETRRKNTADSDRFPAYAMELGDKLVEKALDKYKAKESRREAASNISKRGGGERYKNAKSGYLSEGACRRAYVPRSLQRKPRGH